MKKMLLFCGVVLAQLTMTAQFNVTFRVDMTNVTDVFTAPEVNGTFNNWCGNCSAMSDMDADNIWEITIPLEAGSYEYKFSADNWALQENLLQGSVCTVTNSGFTNRILTVSEDVTLDAVCWEACVGCNEAPVPVDITFQLDMSTVTEMYTTPEVNGTFNNWCGNCNPLSDDDMDGIWTTTLSLMPGTYEYKFAADNWTIQETLTPGSTCTVTNGGFTNRTLVVAEEATLDVVCWASCLACNVEPSFYNVTFQVDMTNLVGTFTTPEVNGTFNNWCGNCNPLTDENGDNIWETTISLEAGSYEFKYSADAWGIQETLTEGSSCTMTTGGFTNRVITVGEDIVMDPVCWEACTACNVVEEPVNVTFQVDMNNVTAAFTTPEVNGTFNNWCGNCNPLSDINGDGIWETTLPLLPGNYEYKFSADAWAIQETLMEGSACTVTADGFTNRTIEVTGETILDIVCWESCTACEVLPTTYDVHFAVDMSQYAGTFTTPEVNGTFNNWCGGCAPMSDADGDNIWELTIALEMGSYEFKYAVDSWADSEQLTDGGSCTVNNGGFINRVVDVESDLDLGIVCWASCEACDVVSTTKNITFRLNMAEVTDTYTTPEINGTFNNWCGACAPMSDMDGNGVWELTIPLEPGAYEYKFAADNWAIQENMPAGSSCTITTGEFTNRALTVTEDAVLDIVCWSSCQDCGQSSGPYNVTFKVDMSQSGETFTTPEINGTFNNWCGGCAPMSDTDGDNVWEITVSLPAGMHEYKFAYDSWAGQETLTSGSICTVTADGFTNRFINVTENTVLDEVCWESCEACFIGINETENTVLGVYPNPASDMIMINTNALSFGVSHVQITNALGQVIYSDRVAATGTNTISTEQLENGLYFVVATDGTHSVIEKFVVQH
jgi:1,4-alpha-glucan branching enzyme